MSSAPAKSDRPNSANSRPLAEICTRGIRDMINTGELKPGDQLKQEDLAERFGVSRFPFRQALSALTSDGLLRHVKNVGFFVAELNEHEFSQLYLMRRHLETEIYRSIDGRYISLETAEHFEELFELHSRRDNADQLAVLNRRFHFEIFNQSPLTVVTLTVNRIWDMCSLYQTRHLVNQETHVRRAAEHRELLARLREGDIEGAIVVADEHRRTTGEVLFDGSDARVLALDS
jgi:DNA-binding GntR family transcriptional regulator